ncbi:zinc finger BED domain-containing protein RICESLEEPER 1-like [Cornus florida]|uniref:zinc finger BED domain-containing protein RICESLEEPER 1-like n=1 Tax=Cornus florida TaxID=4283 RepID=UPI0028964745|nr:zinc finger BED domain-containing protein RICESLEEPER 1-like [Cornus florida]XP_059661395.1 zinc finger BED domain-containing protein RICESLEEPER 1-like [Cornus florida]XP_059661396.1 zinc finger BED domain-containing protein RICESLEEPER 1-like [Cornus florida]
MEISSETPIKKPKRLTSVVWNHFERVKKADVCYAVCVHCKKKLSGSSNSGTTHLRNHLIRCLKRSNYDVSQILAAKRKRKESNLSLTVVNHDEGQKKDEIINVTPMNFKYDQEQRKEETINLGSIKFDQERSQLDLARMIMLHGYPLAMVEHVGFKMFVKNLQPLFEVMTNSTIELDCMTIYGKERQKVHDMIHGLHGRISLAVDMWTSPENAWYLCLTANYIDEDWNLQKKMVNFVTLDSSNTDYTLSEVVIKCLIDWSIDHKLFAMTFDDCSTHDDVVIRIKEWLSQNKPLLKNGQLFDVRCAARVIKSIVQDAMEALQDVIHKIRESIRYIKSSQATLGKFNEIAQQAGINSQKRLFLDCPMKWNSTYLMLEAAAEYRCAFSLLLDHDPAYTMALSEREWEWTSSVAVYMKLCVDITDVFSANKCPTANIYFPEICDLHIQLIEWCKSEDDFVCSMALKMKAKFDKYWSKCSLALAIAAILDPRFKMKLVEYYYSQIYGCDAPDRIKDVSDGIKELFNEYSVSSNSLDQDPARPGSSLASTSNGTRDRLKGFDKFLHETSQSQSIISDLDKYIEEPIFPRNYDFNILNWWKVHTPRYPILSMMARDILGVPVSTVGAELAFSTGGRVLDHHRSSLNPEIREALICGQDWLRMELEGTNPSTSHSAQPHLMETI